MLTISLEIVRKRFLVTRPVAEKAALCMAGLTESVMFSPIT